VIFFEHPKPDFQKSPVSCSPESLGEKCTPQAPAPAGGIYINRCDLTNRSPELVFISKRFETTETAKSGTVYCNEYVLFRLFYGFEPSRGTIWQIEVVEYFIGDEAAVCDLPGPDVDASKGLGVLSLGEANSDH
jgi:hypothetical protein